MVLDEQNGGLRAIADADLAEDPLELRLHGLARDVQARRDLRVGQTVTDQPEDFLLTLGEIRSRALALEPERAGLGARLDGCIADPVALKAATVGLADLVEACRGLGRATGGPPTELTPR